MKTRFEVQIRKVCSRYLQLPVLIILLIISSVFAKFLQTALYIRIYIRVN